MTKSYYIHGYMSEPDSTKGTLLKQKLGVIPIKYRSCPPEELIISECLENISKTIKNDDEINLIGSSLGGFLAAKTAVNFPSVKKLILFNPAIIPIDYDILKIKDMPQSILRDMISPDLFNKIDCDIFILIGTKDDVVPNNWVIDFAKNQQATVKFLDDDHSFSENIEKIPKIISPILDKKH